MVNGLDLAAYQNASDETYQQAMAKFIAYSNEFESQKIKQHMTVQTKRLEGGWYNLQTLLSNAVTRLKWNA